MINLNEGDLFDEHYKLISLIDSGGFSEVWKAHYITGDKIVALKIYPRLGDEGIRSVENEYNNFFELQHSNLLNARHFGRYKGHPYLVMRYYPGGNASNKIGEISEPEVAKCISQIASALKYLHAKGIAHLDIKPNNFLLDENGDYHLADLGLSMKLRSTIRRYSQTINSNSSITSIGITPEAYRAPELCDDETITASLATDIWAMGASLYELITAYTPFGEKGWSKEKSGRQLKSLPLGYSDSLNKILRACLSEKEADRPTAAQLERWANNFIETGDWKIPQELVNSDHARTQRLNQSDQKNAGDIKTSKFESLGNMTNKPDVRITSIGTDESLTEKIGKFIGKRFWIILIAAVGLFFLIKFIVTASSDNNTSVETTYRDTSDYVAFSVPKLKTYRNQLPTVDKERMDTTYSKVYISFNYTKAKNYISINSEIYNFNGEPSSVSFSNEEFSLFNCVTESDGSPYDIYYEVEQGPSTGHHKIIVVGISPEGNGTYNSYDCNSSTDSPTTKDSVAVRDTTAIMAPDTTATIQDDEAKTETFVSDLAGISPDGLTTFRNQIPNVAVIDSTAMGRGLFHFKFDYARRIILLSQEGNTQNSEFRIDHESRFTNESGEYIRIFNCTGILPINGLAFDIYLNKDAEKIILVKISPEGTGNYLSYHLVNRY